ncbi:MAG: hypothetical protein KDI30_13240 [Pseudomonadales bacterium]|nr:hypothetical protein [Pseudomonadales bacterium]
MKKLSTFLIAATAACNINGLSVVSDDVQIDGYLEVNGVQEVSTGVTGDTDLWVDGNVSIAPFVFNNKLFIRDGSLGNVDSTTLDAMRVQHYTGAGNTGMISPLKTRPANSR